MEDYLHGLKKLIGYFATGIMALLFFGITGWLLLLFIGYSYLQGDSSDNTQSTSNAQPTVGYSQQSQIIEGGKLPPEQVTTPIKQGE